MWMEVEERRTSVQGTLAETSLRSRTHKIVTCVGIVNPVYTRTDCILKKRDFCSYARRDIDKVELTKL